MTANHISLRPSSAVVTQMYCHEQEARRRKLAEAAEARMKAHEGRGLKNPEALKLRQKRIEELERKHHEESNSEGGLRVRQCKVTLIIIEFKYPWSCQSLRL